MRRFLSGLLDCLLLTLVLLFAAILSSSQNQQFTGVGAYVPWPVNTVGITFNSSLVIDATGEKAAQSGQVWFPARTGSKTIDKVHFRFGTVTKAGGSGLNLSLQDVSLTTGPPKQPDGTVDQYRAIANGEATFASNTWYTSGLITSDGTDTGTKRTVNYGDQLAVVLEYDGGGRLGADSVVMSMFAMDGAGQFNNYGLGALYTASWASVYQGIDIVLEFSDATFGTISSGQGVMPAKAIATASFAVNTAGADEYALEIKFPFPVKLDGAWFHAATAVGSDFEIVLYSGTTALQTVTVDYNAIGINATRIVEVVFPETALTANTLYRLAIRPTTTVAVQLYYLDVNNAAFLDLLPGGQAFAYSTRVDQGAWSATTTTRRLFGGVRISSLSDGVGGGGGSYTFVQ